MTTIHPPNRRTLLLQGCAAAALPLFAGRVAAQQRSFEPRVEGWRGSRENLSMLPIVQEAVWRDRQLRIRSVRGRDGGGRDSGGRGPAK